MVTSKSYRVKIDEDTYSVADPVITGLQLLDTAGKRPSDEYLIFYLLSGGQLEEIRLDETVDLRQPDMFYLEPWIKLVQGNRYPKAANNPFSFSGRSWQRWSRHNNEWRRGVDGIWTMLKRIEYALEVAA